jgi:hypothetical protein
MIDIKVITIKDILVVSDVGFVSNFSPRTLDIYGEKFLQADEVYINDLPAPEFVIVSDTNLLAQVPDSQTSSRIRSVTVLAVKPSPDRRSTLHFEVGRTLSSLKGLQRLIQFYCKILLQTPGSDRFHPDEGGGLLSLVGQPVGKKNSSIISAAVSMAINRARDQVITRQGKITRIPPDERLLRADLQGIGYNPNTTTLAARVSIGAVSGREAVANLTF